MLRRVSGKGTSVVVSGCGQTVSFRQDGLWQHNDLVVGRMTELPVLVVRVYLSWTELLKDMWSRFTSNYPLVRYIKEGNEIVLTQLCFKM